MCAEAVPYWTSMQQSEGSISSGDGSLSGFMLPSQETVYMRLVSTSPQHVLPIRSSMTTMENTNNCLLP